MTTNYHNLMINIMSLPTAPFKEEAVSSYIRNWAEGKPFTLSEDKTGNIYVTYHNKGNEHWVLAAHMDHPGFEVISQEGTTVTAWFRGGVKEEYFPGSKVSFMTETGVCKGRIESVTREQEYRWLHCKIEVDGEVTLKPGTFGMWDLEVFATDGNLISCRVCDDLAGVASIMQVLDNLAQSNAECYCTGLFTRAEEVGFVGAIGACKERDKLQGAHIIAVETSKAQPNAGLGDGVVIRVGDKASVFDPVLTGYVTSVATAVSKGDEEFSFVRMLMPGGTCESTVYCASGHSATGLCLALGNYHNMGPENKPAPEQIDFNDYCALVKLMESVVVRDDNPQDYTDEWLAKVHTRFDKLSDFL